MPVSASHTGDVDVCPPPPESVPWPEATEEEFLVREDRPEWKLPAGSSRLPAERKARAGIPALPKWKYPIGASRLGERMDPATLRNLEVEYRESRRSLQRFVPPPPDSLPPQVRLLVPRWCVWDPFGCSLPRREAIPQVEAALLALRLANTQISLRLAEGLRRVRDGIVDPMRVGERSHCTYARNWLGISASRASELAGLAASLEKKMPLVSTALDGGVLSISQAMELRMVVEPETEWVPTPGGRRAPGEGDWVRLARKCPVRVLREAVKKYREEVKGIPDDKEKMEGVEIEGKPEDLTYLWTEGGELAEKVHGDEVSKATLMEWLCAEYASAHVGPLPEVKRVEQKTDFRELRRKLEKELKDETIPDLPPDDGEEVELPEPAPCPLDKLPDPTKARTMVEMDKVLQELMAFRQALDWQAGRLLNVSRRLLVPFDANEVLGVSPRWSAYQRQLDMDLQLQPALRDAYITGRLGWLKLKMLLEVCGPDTALSWAEEAESVSLLRLTRVVEADEGQWALNGPNWSKLTGAGPPSDEILRQLEILPGGHRHASCEGMLRVANVRVREVGLKGKAGAAALTTTRFRAPPEVATLYYSVLTAIMMKLRTSDQGRCMRHLVDHFKETYEAEHKALGGRHPVQERDSHCCRFPSCWSRVTESDHIEMKSRGGGNEMANLIPLCALHHGIAKHLGMARIWGTAPDDVYFQVGTPTACGGGYPIWKDDRIIAVLETEDEARAWAERHKRNLMSGPGQEG